MAQAGIWYVQKSFILDDLLRPAMVFLVDITERLLRLSLLHMQPSTDLANMPLTLRRSYTNVVSKIVKDISKCKSNFDLIETMQSMSTRRCLPWTLGHS